MRGKIKAQTKYKQLRESMLQISNEANFNELFSTFRITENINHLIYNCCDKDENLNWNLKNPVTVLYQVLRIADKPVRWRDLENFADLAFYGNAQRALAETFIILYCLNLIEAKLPVSTTINNLSDQMLVFIKEDNN